MVAAIQRLTGGGADVSYEVTGVPGCAGTSFGCCPQGWRMYGCFYLGARTALIQMNLPFKKKSLKGIIAYRHIFLRYWS